MSYLIDTSVLVRLANTVDTFYPVATRAVLELHRRGEVMHVTPQNLVEFHNVATRPAAVNGLGMSVVDAVAKAEAFATEFTLLAETPDIYPAWKTLVSAMAVVGRQVHDARLVAVCLVHGVSHLLTFNFGHFVRLVFFGPGIVVVDPASV